MDKQHSFFSLLFVSFAFFLAACSSNQSVDPVKQRGDSVARTTGTSTMAVGPTGATSFVSAARAAMPTVVHIQVRLSSTATPGNPYGLPINRQAAASGSGVIISTDGYIAMNNHVVEAAAEISVVLPDKRRFAATLVGRDPNTDLALLKIEATALPALPFGNSDNIQIGEWVLAVGFPLSLNTTVTAGIVSAKARSIGIINSRQNSKLDGNLGNAAVESFIQTDAAINPGNSGGALVNTAGELVGINNTAIASPTGSFSGYAFAIPANLVRKILGDLQQYGTVKRGVLGVAFPSPSAEDRYMVQKGLNPAAVKGVYITDVQPASAAAEASLKEGDIIQSIDGIELSSSAEFSERIARRKPGDVVNLAYLRNGKAASVSVTLKDDKVSTVRNVNSLQEIYSRLGAAVSPLPAALKQQLGLAFGVLVTSVLQDGFFYQVGIQPGTVIAFINGQPVSTQQDVAKALFAAQNSPVQVLAIAPDGSKVVFNFSIGT